jgi:hypothetical protein
MSNLNSNEKSSKNLNDKIEQQKNQPTLVSLYDIDDYSAHHCGYCNQNGNISIGWFMYICIYTK